MKNLVRLGAVASVFTWTSFLVSGEAGAQCATCPTPVVAYSPVVYNTYQVEEGWYPGKLIGRLGQRLFGTAPAPAYANYTAAYPMTYAAGYAPTYAAAYAPTYSAAYAPTYATAYAPVQATAYATSYAPTGCTTCGVNPCSCCTQTTYRPVIMQPAVEQTTYYSQGCSTCGTATSTATIYDAQPAGGCANCTANYAEQAIHQAPLSTGVGAGTAAGPPQTFREEPRNEPTPASGTSASDGSKSWDPPQLFAPGDKQVKRPSTAVWTAVYEQPVTSARPATRAASVSQGTAAPAKKLSGTWVAVE